MPNWFSNRDEEFIFRRVEFATWKEIDTFSYITGGNMEKSSLSDAKESGSLNFEGSEVPPNGDLVRIYYRFRDALGEITTHPVATMFAHCAEPTFNGSKFTGALTCSSVLTVLMKKKVKVPYTVKAGTPIVSLAISLIQDFGLRVNNPGPSAYTLKSDHVFEPTDSYLTVVNWLLTTAGYMSCFPDAYGVVQIAKYVEPIEREAVLELADDAQSIMYPQFSKKINSWFAPNVYALLYETDSEVLSAETRNIDPDSPASLVNMYEQSEFETLNEIAGDTTEERLENLKAMSKSKLLDNSADIEYVVVKHAWVPTVPNDAIKINYVAAGYNWKGAITNIAIDFVKSIPCQTTARKFIRRNLLTETVGEVIYSDQA